VHDVARLFGRRFDRNGKRLQLTRAQSQLESMYSQTLPAMQNAMRQSLATQMNSEEATRLLDAVLPRFTAMMREEMSWARLEPEFAALYAATFTQEEIDGLIAFYESPIGAALVNKMPQLTQRSMLMMQQHLGPMMQKLTQITREEVARASAAATTDTGASGAKR